MENNSLERASSFILKHNSSEYIEEHKKFIQGVPTVLKYESNNSIIFAIGVQHINDPNSDMIKSIKKIVLEYFNQVPKEKRLIIVEGFSEVKPLCKATFEESVIEGGEPMGVTFLAKQNDTEVISPEPTDKLSVKNFLDNGFSKEEIILFLFLRQLTDMIIRYNAIKGRENTYLIHLTSQIKEIIEISWLNDFDGTDKSLIPVINKINSISKSYLGKDLFKIEDNIVLPNLSYDEANNQFFAPYSLTFGDVKITNKINAFQDDIRDYRILIEIYKSVNSGRSPLIVYGRSHVIRLKPALDYLYSNLAQAGLMQ